MDIVTERDGASAGKRIRELLDTDGPDAAISFAESCNGPQPVIDQLRALAYTEAGSILSDRDRLEDAVELWRKAGAEEHNAIGYNLANTELELWRLAKSDRGFVIALQEARSHLREARRLFRRVGDDDALLVPMRVQALTNLGNSYDSEGRDIDAIATYNEALALDPQFGMALGNKGMALLYVAPFASNHQATVIAEARRALDDALLDETRILEFGGPSALEHFRDSRAKITTTERASQHHASRVWVDPYLRWCAQHGLFLHVSLTCMSEDDDDLDPLFFRGVTVGLDDAEQHRAHNLIDAFNALKQDFTAARYLLWLTDGDASPIRKHAAVTSARVGYLDTSRYQRWGTRTGLAIQAFAAASNLLDKVASAVHLYYDTSRKSRTVYFRYLRHRRNKPNVMDCELIDAAATRGLRALCDLSCDLEAETALNKLVDRRHTATHRFLTVHTMSTANHEAGGDWLEHVDWRDLVRGTIVLLGTARSALIYLSRMIDIEEHRRTQTRNEDAERAGKPALVPPMPLIRSLPEDPKFD